MKSPTRREVVIAVASAGIAGATAGLLERRRSTSAQGASAQATSPVPPTSPQGLRVLGDAEYAALAAACELVYPRDGDPGAVDLGVPLYIDRALDAAQLPPWGDGILTGLARLDSESFRRFAVPFCRARSSDQNAIFAEWAGQARGDNAEFARHLVTATLEGVLGDPTHGGNRDGKGWSALGFRPDPFAPSQKKKAL
jgi:gluconate 2-dehydrogenase gamma chain